MLWVTQQGHRSARPSAGNCTSPHPALTPRVSSHFEGTLTANGVHEWARGKLAGEEIGEGLAACDACRVTLEGARPSLPPLAPSSSSCVASVTGRVLLAGMHRDWGSLTRRLVLPPYAPTPPLRRPRY